MTAISWLAFSLLVAACTGLRYRLEGPGLQPDNIVHPCRYFFVRRERGNTSEEEVVEEEGGLVVNIVGEDEAGQGCRVMPQLLPDDGGDWLVRYKLHFTCRNLVISVVHTRNGVAVVGSPVRVEGPALPDTCHCPAPSLEAWRTSQQCGAAGGRLDADLEPYQAGVNMRAAVGRAEQVLSEAGSQCWCHYTILAGRVYRRCYGQHVGFSMFWDSLLSWLGRRVVLPDTELMVNLGDWPLITASNKDIPMFSWCGSHSTHDLLFPTYDLTESSLECLGRVSLDVLAVLGTTSPPWRERQEKLFWRGRDSSRERLQLVRLAKQYPHLINASITAFFFFRDQEAELGRAKHVSFFRFFDYKYQLCLDGTVAAYRLPYLLAGGSVVFKQESSYYEHFYPELEAWTHFIPVKRDLSDLLERLDWARHHDTEARRIAENARDFAHKRLLPGHVLCYTAAMLSRWADLVTSKVEIQPGMEEVLQKVDDRSKPCECNASKKQEYSKDEL